MDLSRLDEAIYAHLRGQIPPLRAERPDLAVLALGLVEDLTGFYLCGADARWLASLPGTPVERSQAAWWPDEWPLMPEYAAGQSAVTAAIWELSGTQAMLDGTGTELDDDDYDRLRTRYEERIIHALERIRAEGLLRRTDGSDLWIWLHSVDDSDEELAERSFRALQEPEIAAEFADRWDEGSERLLARIAALS